MSVMFLGPVLIFPTKFHPDPSTLSVFQVLGSSSQLSPPHVTRSVRDLNKNLLTLWRVGGGNWKSWKTLINVVDT